MLDILNSKIVVIKMTQHVYFPKFIIGKESLGESGLRGLQSGVELFACDYRQT